MAEVSIIGQILFYIILSVSESYENAGTTSEAYSSQNWLAGYNHPHAARSYLGLTGGEGKKNGPKWNVRAIGIIQLLACVTCLPLRF